MASIEIRPRALPRQILWAVTARSLLKRYAEYRRKRRALAQLRGLDAATLRDLAIDRSELSSIVHGGSHGRRRSYGSDRCGYLMDEHGVE